MQGNMALTEPTDRRVAKVLTILESRPESGLEELAGAVHLSVSRLEHIFKNQTGTCLRDCVQEHRLQAAARMLKSTELRIKEITFAVGYRHPPSFVRAFRRRFECAPQVFRDREQNRLTNSSSG